MFHYQRKDPFFGSGTTGAVATRLHRRWIGIEKEDKYIHLARKRIDFVQPESFEESVFSVQSKKKSAVPIPFSTLLENGLLQPGQILLFKKDSNRSAKIKPDSHLLTDDGFTGTIHSAGSHFMNGAPCNGWEHWYVRENGNLIDLDTLRQRFRVEMGLNNG